MYVHIYIYVYIYIHHIYIYIFQLSHIHTHILKSLVRSSAPSLLPSIIFLCLAVACVGLYLSCRWTFGCVLLIVLAVQLWMVYVKAKEANSPSSTGILVCVVAHVIVHLCVQ